MGDTKPTTPIFNTKSNEDDPKYFNNYLSSVARWSLLLRDKKTNLQMHGLMLAQAVEGAAATVINDSLTIDKLQEENDATEQQLESILMDKKAVITQGTYHVLHQLKLNYKRSNNFERAENILKLFIM